VRPDLVELIGASVKLRRAGRRWVGLCPFHPDRHPSFNVFHARHGGWLWNCLVCQEHGDEITWLRKTRNMTYGEAAKELGRPGAYKPHPAILAARAAEEAREAKMVAFLDRHPDTCLPAWIIAWD
jgi:DNA primase